MASGRLAAGDFLPSVRQVALELEVNPMTVSKAYSLLGARRRARAGPRAGDAGRRARTGAGGRQPERAAGSAVAAGRARLAAEAYAALSLSRKQVQALLDRAFKELDGK